VTWQDVCFAAEGGALVYIPRSKTDQVGQGAWVFIAACREELFMLTWCPVAALRLLKGVAESEHADLGGPVFRGRPGGSSGGPGKNLSGSSLEESSAGCGCKGVGVVCGTLVAHGWRHRWAVRQGVSWRRVQIMGRWKSDVVREYLYSSVTSMWAASAQLQSG
jgi:integrase